MHSSSSHAPPLLEQFLHLQKVHRIFFALQTHPACDLLHARVQVECRVQLQHPRSILLTSQLPLELPEVNGSFSLSVVVGFLLTGREKFLFVMDFLFVMRWPFGDGFLLRSLEPFSGTLSFAKSAFARSALDLITHEAVRDRRLRQRWNWSPSVYVSGKF